MALPNYKSLLHKNKNLKRNYGITLLDYRSAITKQNNRCPGCHLVFKETTRRARKSERRPENEAVVDHCHSTNEVRGILCHKCNIAVGHMNDNPHIALRLAQYLCS